MAQVFITGAKISNWKDKDTRQTQSGLTLYYVNKNIDTHGLMTEKIFFSSDKPMYNKLLTNSSGALDFLINRYARVERGSKGFVEDFELGEKIAVTPDFGL